MTMADEEESQEQEAIAIYNEPSSDVAAAEEDDDDFGTISAYETAESNDCPSDGGKLAENASATVAVAGPTPPPAMVSSSSSLNEGDFFDAASTSSDEPVGDDAPDENAEMEEGAAVVEKGQSDDVDLFGGITGEANPNDYAAAEEPERLVEDNTISDTTTADPFAAFNGVARNSEAAGEQNETDYEQNFNIVAANVVGEFEGAGNKSPGIIDVVPLNNGRNDPVVNDSHVVDELDDEHSCPEPLGLNLLPDEAPLTKETYETDSLKGDASACNNSNPFSQMNEITKCEQPDEVASEITSLNVTLSALDALPQIQDAPPPLLDRTALNGEETIFEKGDALNFRDSAPFDAVIETATRDVSNEIIGEFMETNFVENAIYMNTNNDDLVNNTTKETEKGVAEDIEITPEAGGEYEAITLVETPAENVNESITQDNDVTLFRKLEETITPFPILEEPITEIDLAEITDKVIETAPTPMENTTDSLDAQDDSVVFSSFEGTGQGTIINTFEKDELISEVKESDDFGNLYTEEVHSAPVEEVVEETNLFRNVSAPFEKNKWCAEEDVALAKGANEEADFGEFGGFSAPSVVEDAAVAEVDLPVEEDAALTEHETTFPDGGIEYENDFGNFSAPAAEAPQTEVTDLNGEKVAPVETAVEETNDFSDFPAPAAMESALAEKYSAPVALDEEESDDFGDFSASVEELARPEEAAVNEHDEFGDFGGFSSPSIEDEAPIEAAKEETDDDFNDFDDAVTNESEQVLDASEYVDNSKKSSSEQSDDFGKFGDFSAPVEAGTVSYTEGGPNESQSPIAAELVVEGDDDFGDFAEFEEAAPEAVNADSHQTGQAEATEDDRSPPPATTEEDAEFGDFGDFEESDVIKETNKSEPSGPVLVLNENVRNMFQKVFLTDRIVDPDKGDGCPSLPFDVPMRTVLAPRKSNSKEKDASQIYNSEKEIQVIKDYIESLPTSPPSTILSEEKWYPYSHYIFNHDGTPYTTKLLSVATPSVPEVLPIELPAGFDVSSLSSKSSFSHSNPTSYSTPSKQSTRPTATMVDFPSGKMTGEEAKEAAEDDEFGKLSAAGKKFLEQLPDLSYMLQPTLSSVKRQ